MGAPHPVKTPLHPVRSGISGPSWSLFAVCHFGTDRALRQGDWKVVAAKGGRWELYNLADDRTELHDLRTQQPARAQRMIDQWFRLAKEIDRLPPRQLKPETGTLTPLRFGPRQDPAPNATP